MATHNWPECWRNWCPAWSAEKTFSIPRNIRNFKATEKVSSEKDLLFSGLTVICVPPGCPSYAANSKSALSTRYRFLVNMQDFVYECPVAVTISARLNSSSCRRWYSGAHFAAFPSNGETISRRISGYSFFNSSTISAANMSMRTTRDEMLVALPDEAFNRVISLLFCTGKVGLYHIRQLFALDFCAVLP